MLNIINTALKDQDKHNFKPFAILEDDVSKYRDWPNTLAIPENADMIFIGLSRFGFKKDNSYIDSVYYESIDDELIRIYNMLSNHGLLITSLQGTMMFQKAIYNALYTNIPHDVYLASFQHYYNVYALKVPLVYQYPPIGGVPDIYTRIEFTEPCCVKDYSDDYVLINIKNQI